MLTLKQLREERESTISRLSKKGIDATSTIDKIELLDDKRKAIQQELDANLFEQNTISKEIGELFKSGKKELAESLKLRSATLKESAKSLENNSKNVAQELNELIITLPNCPSDLVPEGNKAQDNVTIKEGGEMPQLTEKALPHWELTKKYDIIDFELGTKLTGAGFPVYKGAGARLQRALINYFVDCNTSAGYTEIMPPLMVNEASGFGTGQLPDKEGQMYHCQNDNLYLIPTSEVPLTNMFRDVILSQNELPIKLTSYTPCFRREAGSYGKDVRGLNRLHQFDKVEIVQITEPQHSYATLDSMVAHVESIIQSLKLPYRILRLCGGDMSFTSALTYDFEVYSAAQKQWLEVSSVSNFESFQSNRLKLRYKDTDKKTKLAHTLNGSSLALPRIVAALLENNQTNEGIIIPEVLRAYTGFNIIK